MKRNLILFTISTLIAAMIPAVSYGFCTDSVPSSLMQAAKSLHSEKVLRGNPSGACSLGNALNRVEFATFVLRNGYTDEDIQDLAKMEKGGFPDLKKGVWYESIAKAAKFEGLIKGDGGTGKGRFSDGVNGAEAIVITLRGMNVEIPSPRSGEQWYDPAINIAKAGGVKTHSPTHKMTRGDAVLMIHQVNEYVDHIESAASTYGSGSSSSHSSTSHSSTDHAADFKKLLSEFETMSPQEGAKIYNAMTTEQKGALELFSPNFALVFLAGACQADSSLTLNTSFGVMNCTQGTQTLNGIMMQLQQNPTAAQQYMALMQQEGSTLLVYYLCDTKDYQGDVNAQNCSQVMGQARSAIAQYQNPSTATPTYTAPTNTYTPPASSTPGYVNDSGSDLGSVDYWLNNYGSGSGNSSSGGGYDPATFQMMQNMNQMSHETSMSIINNIGGGTNCTVGEYGCVPF